MHVAAFYVNLTQICETSAKIIQLNVWACRDAPCEKSWVKKESPLRNTIKDTMGYIMRRYIFGQGVMHDCASTLDWRAGASQPSRTTGTIFLYIYIFSIRRCLSVPVYKLQYFICDTRGPTRNPGKNTT